MAWQLISYIHLLKGLNFCNFNSNLKTCFSQFSVFLSLMTVRFLSNPHPYPEELKSNFKIAILAGLIVAGFLMVFQPFGAYSWQHDLKYLFLAGFGLITFCVLIIFGFLIRKWFPIFFSESNWTVGKEILTQTITIIAIAVCNYGYSLWFSGQLRIGGFRTNDFLFMLWATFLIGVFPSTIITWYSQIKNLKKYSHPYQPVTQSPETINKDNSLQFNILADNGKDVFQITSSDFLFLTSADNYVEVYFLENGTVQKELIRAGISRLESEIEFDFIQRCHRSYMVNLHKVERISGNAQGYRLHLLKDAFSIPVGRSLSEKVLSRIKS